MSTDAFLRFISQALYVVIFLAVVARSIRHPVRANIDTAIFFGVIALVVAEGWLTDVLDLTLGPPFQTFLVALIVALPYLLLRLVDGFTRVPFWAMRLAEIGLAFAVAGLFLLPPPYPLWFILALVAYFFGYGIYVAAKVIGEARRSLGVTRRRLEAVAAGTAALALVILVAGLSAGLPQLRSLFAVVSLALALTSGIAYFVGFAPPGWLRRAWQEPELRAFLTRAAGLPRLTDRREMVHELERGAARALGAPQALIGLWDETAQVLRFELPDGRPVEIPTGQFVAGRVFAVQRPFFSANVARDDPANADLYEAANAVAALIAPIVAGDKRLGVLAAFAPRAPIFVEDDLELVQLLAEQAAVVLENRALIDEATRARARVEATRLKDDFLSAAAHDLKTPLTTIVIQAQLLERRAQVNPTAPSNRVGIERIVHESQRLKGLIGELLDAAQLGQAEFLDSIEAVDLVEVAREACERLRAPHHPCIIESVGPVIGEFSRDRIRQLVAHLIENAVKFSPGGGEVRVRVEREDGDIHLSVSDRGIGIPARDLPYLFDRFHRGSNVDDRRFPGMGLGLTLCRMIAEQHGGRIWAESTPGQGSTFHVVLPAQVQALV